jgi:hypothetical protein
VIISFPAQNVAIQTPQQAIDSVWYDRIKAVEKFINNGAIGQGALATTATTGFAYLPTCAGPPTGVPIAQAGYVPTVFDTTNSKIWIYNGAWKGVVVT